MPANNLLEIQYINHYEESGFECEGPLAVVKYYARQRQIASSQPLQGFGQGACFDALSEAKQLLQSKHPDHTLRLSIPDLVVEISQEEWDTAVHHQQ